MVDNLTGDLEQLVGGEDTGGPEEHLPPHVLYTYLEVSVLLSDVLCTDTCTRDEGTAPIWPYVLYTHLDGRVLCSVHHQRRCPLTTRVRYLTRYKPCTLEPFFVR